MWLGSCHNEMIVLATITSLVPSGRAENVHALRKPQGAKLDAKADISEPPRHAGVVGALTSGKSSRAVWLENSLSRRVDVASWTPSFCRRRNSRNLGHVICWFSGCRRSVRWLLSNRLQLSLINSSKRLGGRSQRAGVLIGH